VISRPRWAEDSAALTNIHAKISPVHFKIELKRSPSGDTAWLYLRSTRA
jgi:hypothetical protein